MRQNILGLFIGLLITGIAAARAENSSVAPNHTTPAALIRQALTNNPELKFYAAEIAAAKGMLKTAGTMRNPELKHRGWLQENAGQFRRTKRRRSVVARLGQPNIRISGSNRFTKSDCEIRYQSCRASSTTVSANARRPCSLAGLQHFNCARAVDGSA